MTWFNGVRTCVRICEALGVIPQHHKPEQADLREVVLTLTRLLGPISLELEQQSQPQSGLMPLNGQSARCTMCMARGLKGSLGWDPVLLMMLLSSRS